MAVKGSTTTGQQEGFSKKVGYGEFRVLKVNPTREELNGILGIESDKGEIEYAGKDTEGFHRMNIHVWVESIKTKEKFPVRFTLTDKQVVGKNSGKTQYINSVGDTGWAMDESGLQGWFTHFKDKDGNVLGDKQYRKAIMGEGTLYGFLRSWFNINYWAADAELSFDTAKLLSGNMNELNNYIGTDITQTVVLMTTVRVVEDDNGDIKEYQSVYNGASMPGKMIRFLRTGSDHKAVKKFKDTIAGEYGCTDYYVVEEMRPYLTGENLAASNNTKIVADDDAEY